MRKTFFELVLHDHVNLSSQIVMYSSDQKELAEISRRMNFLFDNAGKMEQFVAEVYTRETEIENDCDGLVVTRQDVEKALRMANQSNHSMEWSTAQFEHKKMAEIIINEKQKLNLDTAIQVLVKGGFLIKNL